MLVPVNPIEIVNGEPVIHLAPDAANDDWIRAVRLLDKGEKEKVKGLSEQSMYKDVL